MLSVATHCEYHWKKFHCLSPAVPWFGRHHQGFQLTMGISPAIIQYVASRIEEESGGARSVELVESCMLRHFAGSSMATLSPPPPPSSNKGPSALLITIGAAVGAVMAATALVVAALPRFRFCRGRANNATDDKTRGKEVVTQSTVARPPFYSSFSL